LINLKFKFKLRIQDSFRLFRDVLSFEEKSLDSTESPEPSALTCCKVNFERGFQSYYLLISDAAVMRRVPILLDRLLIIALLQGWSTHLEKKQNFPGASLHQ
jgi:hypothetical protein